MERIFSDFAADFVLAALIILGSVRGWIVWGGTHKELLERADLRAKEFAVDRDKWMDIALKGTNLLKEAVSVTKEVAGNATKKG